MPIAAPEPGQGIRMGATLVPGGATFRTWAPNARDVYVLAGDAVIAAASGDTWLPAPADRLIPLGDGTWAGMLPGVAEGDPYLFWVRGPEGGTEGFKRDPHARELGTAPPFPLCPCVARDPRSYPWHDAGWRPPAFNDLVIYQLHVGTFWAVDAQGRDARPNYARFLDVAERVPYLAALGVNAVQLLPIQEYDNDEGLGYAGLDYFSPEMAYHVGDPGELARHLGTINGLLAAKGQPPLAPEDLLPGPNQLKCLVDLCHLHGLGVIFDVVYNHAGGDFGDRSLWFYDRQPDGDASRSLYFGQADWAGGKVFDYGNPGVRRFLIGNAVFLLEEYRIDGLRYDEVRVIRWNGGDGLCRDLTGTARHVRPEAVQIAEYWDWDRASPVTPAGQGGLGFDAAYDDRLREALRAALRQVSGGAGARVDALDKVHDAIYPPPGYPAAWRAMQHVENHDIVLWDVWKQQPRDLRVPRLADPSDTRSWYARSRSRVVTTLLLTAPGIPLLFMGEEILEDKPWCDDVRNWPQFLVWWDGLGLDKRMADFHAFVTDLLHLRRSMPALRGEGVRVPQVHVDDRVIVVHRWVDGEGLDLVVVATLNEGTLHGYPVDMPWPGLWREVFNSDFYDNLPNPAVVGNGGSVVADGPPGATYPHTARVTIPANGALVFARGA